MRAGGVRIAQNLAKPLIARIAASSSQLLRVAVEPSLTPDAVPGQPSLLRLASDRNDPPASYALLERIVADAVVNADGELDLRLGDSDVTGPEGRSR